MVTPYVERLRSELLDAAAAGGEESRALADRLLGPLDSATRLMLLEALSAAAEEITRDLAPGSVQVLLRGRDPEFEVRLPASDAEGAAGDFEDGYHDPAASAAWPPVPHPASAPNATGAPAGSDADDGGTSRINLRLPDSLKARVEEAAGREWLSVNAWLVRAASAALDPGARDSPPPRRGPRGDQRFNGWVR